MGKTLNRAVVNCCADMNHALSRKPVFITYTSNFREYSISISPILRDIIQYCPWCGANLPVSLAATWARLLDERFGNDFNGLADERLPDEFKTDQWWRKRGL